jgi:hypothetical protein
LNPLFSLPAKHLHFLRRNNKAFYS